MNILRVISGSAKGHNLKTPKGSKTRPTTDRVKESLFNIIRQYVPEANVLDLFAGTGSLGIEALSRGAVNAAFIDSDSECISLIKENLQHTKLFERAEVYRIKALEALKFFAKRNTKFDLIFLDPPYSKGLVNSCLREIEKHGLLNEQGIIVVESDKKDEICTIGKLTIVRNEVFGDTAISLIKLGAMETEITS